VPKKTEIMSEEATRANIRRAMEARNFPYDDISSYQELSRRFREYDYSITSTNLRIYIQERRLNVDFLLALARVLNVTLDCLVSDDRVDSANQSLFESKADKPEALRGCFEANRTYNFYYCPIHESDMACADEDGKPLRLKPAYWEVDVATSEVTLTMPPHKSAEGHPSKKYKGFLELTDEDTIFVTLEEQNDKEPFLVILNYDKRINRPFKVAVGLALQIRSMDDKDNRAPVMHRFCLTRDPLNLEGKAFISERLDLRRKLNITGELIDGVVNFSTLWKIDVRFDEYLKSINGYKIPDSEVDGVV